MKKHVYILLVLLIPLLAQRSERKASLSKPSDNAEALFQQTSAVSVPRRISYQGILTKNNGQPATDKVYEVKFRLYKDYEGGDHFWEETQQIDINDGLLSATLGTVSELTIIPSEAYLEVEVEGSILEPRQEMTAVFYSVISDTAYHAKGYTPTSEMSAVALTGDYYDLNNIPELGTVALTGDYYDLNNNPELGTVAVQDTNQINIKGGTIDGVIIGSDSAASAKFSEVNVS